MRMKNNSLRFRIGDIALIVMMILPLVVAMTIKILTTPASEGINVTGAMVYFTLPMPIQSMPITEAQVNSLLVMISIAALCLYLTHGIRAGVETKRQMLAEWIVEKVSGLVRENMGEGFIGFSAFIASILILSALSSLMSLLGVYAPTSDLNVVAGWAILVFALITYYKLKGGLGYYLKGFLEPVPFLLPFNIIGEFATPVSMAFRHYGNVLSGSVIAVLLSYALAALSSFVLGWMPGFIAEIPLFRVGIPAVLSLYFDIFSGCMQAYIFAMLTMLNVSGGFSQEAYEKRQQKKLARRQAKEKIINN